MKSPLGEHLGGRRQKVLASLLPTTLWGEGFDDHRLRYAEV